MNASLDTIAAGHKNFEFAHGFVVKDYTGIDARELQKVEPVVCVVNAEQLFEMISKSAIEKRKIAVYAIGPRVLDLS